MQVAAEVELAFAANNYLGETPLWSPAEQVLYWVNCEQPSEIHRWSPATGGHQLWPMPARVGGIALQSNGTLLVVLARAIYDFDPTTASLAQRCTSPLPKHVSLHECQCDRQGKLWVGSYDHHFSPSNRGATGGALFRLDGTQLTPIVHGISIANALAFSPDGDRIYFTGAARGRVECMDIKVATGATSARRTFVQLSPDDGFADGATVDADGYYWLAAVGGGTLRRYCPDGALDRVVPLPVSNPTKAAFGGEHLDTLYVTTTRLEIGPHSAVNGGLYAMRPGVRGLPEPALQE